MSLGSLTAAAGLGPEVVPVLEVAEGRLARVDRQSDRAASTAVPAVRAASRHVGLAPERGRPGTAITGPDPDPHPVQEHRSEYGTRSAADPTSGQGDPDEASLAQ
jgi:hypothetical protein